MMAQLYLNSRSPGGCLHLENDVVCYLRLILIQCQVKWCSKETGVSQDSNNWGALLFHTTLETRFTLKLKNCLQHGTVRINHSEPTSCAPTTVLSKPRAVIEVDVHWPVRNPAASGLSAQSIGCRDGVGFFDLSKVCLGDDEARLVTHAETEQIASSVGSYFKSTGAFNYVSNVSLCPSTPYGIAFPLD